MMYMNKGFPVIILVIALLSIALYSPCVNAQGKIKILTISPYGGWSTQAASLLSAISMYGDVTQIVLGTGEYTLDFFLQFDVIYTESCSGWKSYPQMLGKIGSAVYEGKSLIVCVTSLYDPSPANAWVSVARFSTPKDWVEYNIVSSNLTIGVKSIKGSEHWLFLYGGYPLVLTPMKPEFPEEPAALAVYGFHGAGRYAVFVGELFNPSRTVGDVGRLVSNVMYWLTGRGIPPPPSVMEIWGRIVELDSLVDELYEKVLDLNSTLNSIRSQIPKLVELDVLQVKVNDLSLQLNQLMQKVNDLSRGIDNLSKQFNDLMREFSTLRTLSYLSIIALFLSLASMALLLVGKIKLPGL
ncbi:MAG: hypothetical protein QXR39_07920 [Candidatus Methanomethylicia archaeon]